MENSINITPEDRAKFALLTQEMKHAQIKEDILRRTQPVADMASKLGLSDQIKSLSDQGLMSVHHADLIAHSSNPEEALKRFVTQDRDALIALNNRPIHHQVTEIMKLADVPAVVKTETVAPSAAQQQKTLSPEEELEEYLLNNNN